MITESGELADSQRGLKLIEKLGLNIIAELATFQLIVRDTLFLMQDRTSSRAFLNRDELKITEV